MSYLLVYKKLSSVQDLFKNDIVFNMDYYGRFSEAVTYFPSYNLKMYTTTNLYVAWGYWQYIFISTYTHCTGRARDASMLTACS